MSNTQGEFRFGFSTDKYEESCHFYQHQLGLEVVTSWNRGEDDQGSFFQAAKGIIAIVKRPEDEQNQFTGLDYRAPQGTFMVIQVWDIDERFAKYKAQGVAFKQEIVDQAWGHRTFSVLDPNGLVLLFLQYPSTA